MPSRAWLEALMVLLITVSACSAPCKDARQEIARLERARADLEALHEELHVAIRQRLFSYDMVSAYDVVLTLMGGLDNVGPAGLQMVAEFPSVAMVVACRGWATEADFVALGIESPEAARWMFHALANREDDAQIFILDDGQRVVGWFPVSSWSDDMPDEQVTVFRNSGALYR